MMKFSKRSSTWRLASVGIAFGLFVDACSGGDGGARDGTPLDATAPEDAAPLDAMSPDAQTSDDGAPSEDTERDAPDDVVAVDATRSDDDATTGDDEDDDAAVKDAAPTPDGTVADSAPELDATSTDGTTVVDAATPDATLVVDATTPDATAPDSSIPTDATAPDATADATTIDATVQEAAAFDASGGDAGSRDATVQDAGAEDGATACQTLTDAGWQVAVPAQTATAQIAFDVAIQGATPDVSLSFARDQGTFQVGGETLAAVLYQAPVLSDTGESSFQGIAATPDRWIIFWPYCQAGSLVWLDYETSDTEGLVRSPATGTCAWMTAAASPSLSWPAERVALDTSAAAAFQMSGANLSWSGTAPGTATFSGSTWSFWPFAFVDCTDCASPGSPGWFELHALLQTGPRAGACGQTCFGIYYLYEETGNPIVLGWTSCLPDLAPPDDTLTIPFDATWTQ